MHLKRIEGGANDLRFTFFVPPALAADYERLASDDERFAWIAAQLREQGDTASNHDLGILTLYGLGTPRDAVEARRLVEPAITAGKLQGAQHLAWERVSSPDQPAASREAVPVIRALLEASDWWSMWAANSAWGHLAKTREPGDRALRDSLREPAKETLLAALAGKLDAEQSKTVQNFANQWCGHLLNTKEDAVIEDVSQITEAWLRATPDSHRAKICLLGVLILRKDNEKQYALATELKESAALDESERYWVVAARFQSATKSGRVVDRADTFYLLKERIFSTKLWLVPIIALACVELLLAPLLTRYRRSGALSWWHIVLWLIWGVGFAGFLMFPMPVGVPAAVMAVLLMVFAATGPRDLGFFQRPKTPNGDGFASWGKIVGWCVLLFGVYVLFCIGYGWAYEKLLGKPLEAPIKSLLQSADVFSLLGIVVIAGICGPFSEEIVFRGFFQGWLGQRLRPLIASLITAAVFGLLHGLDVAIPIALIGLMLSWLRVRYQSLWPPILLHALTNTLFVIGSYFFAE